MRYRLTREAEEDIIGIAETSLRLFGQIQARRYHNELFDLIDLIAAIPRMARERLELTPPVRVQPFRQHLIVYRIEEDGGVLVIRVRHAHEDWIADGT
jgi:toxin ParE1/3/4